ncbi:MAG: DEAD/DEAH box helicase family protein [Clostridiales bacterium]|nr:DEAD/DEAH box helicase family protein [Clostridiales bacterium]
MSIYDFQRATADRIADIFQQSTIDADGNEIKSGGQRRVLLADEVGLGKTHVASAVIDRVREMRKKVNDDMFRVVYVCSNMSIANQNIEKLGVKNKADVTESRLSMQHLTIREREAKIVNPENDEMGEIIIPLTPSTSFSLRGSSKGNANERALIATILGQFDDFSKFRHQLSKLFQGWSGDKGWEDCMERYSKRVDALGKSYINEVRRYLVKNHEFLKIKKDLIENFNHGDISNLDSTIIINLLRRIFADLSLSMLEPDLIIMDEFQRFSSLLDYSDESEQSVIVKKFFDQEDGQQPLILLLSATPYKPFSTLEELTEYNADEHYEDFNRLMNFLFSGENGFRELWSDYSQKLSHINTEKFDVILASKQSAEEKMYQGMCRTERLNEGLISTQAVTEVPISTDDILSYCEMQKIVLACKEATERSAKHHFSWSNVPMEYVKSSPYLLSFMDTYELKQKIGAIYQGGFKGLPVPSHQVLLRENDLAQFHKIPMCNARMQYLRDLMLPKGRGAEYLLWVPASRPYYTTNAENPFVKNRDFSKTLVFSAWEMVPRMIATLMTYEAEREVIFSKYKKASYDKKTGADRLKDIAQKIITFPSKYLASLFTPKNFYGEKIHNIRANIRRQIKEKLGGITISERCNYGKILHVIKWLDDLESELPEEMPRNTVDVLTDMAIASPGVCLYRILKDVDIARDVAKGFSTIFNRRISGYIIDKLHDKYNEDEFFLDGVMDYCVMGNLQAVLDEYRHLCSSNDDFVARMKEAIIREVPLQVDTYESFYEKSSNKKGLRTFYAVPFSKSKNTVDEKSELRSNNIRTAFQSPFYPFVVASTSVGQEGLDFHWYCRKIVHWNPPSNPQDLEQREGRINRYKCLAIRRNIAKIFPDIYEWDKLFDIANDEVRRQFGRRYSEMVPNWCLPTEWLHDPNIAIEWIERIVPQYPMSNDVDKYKRLIDVLSLYRLTMGQPRQEDLLDMLESQHLEEKQIRQLLFNLSPISRRNK